MIICDTSGLIAYFDQSDAHHVPVNTVITADPGPFIVSPYVLAELDYLLATRRGVQAEIMALRELSGGAWDLPDFKAADIANALKLIERYADQNIGLADASLVILAERYRTDRLLTLDHRHFTVVRTLSGKQFTLLPTQ